MYACFCGKEKLEIILHGQPNKFKKQLII